MTTSRDSNALHRIVIVGGGAGGLELATRLGDSVGRRRQAQVTLIDRSRTHLWKPLLHEVAAGSMDVDEHDARLPGAGALASLPLSARRAWTGSTAQRREVQVAPTIDEDGRELITRARDPLRHAGDRRRQPDQRLRHAGRAASTRSALDTPPQAERFHRRLVNACIRANAQTEAAAPGATAGRDHRRRRDRRRARGRAAQHDARAGGLRPRQHRSRASDIQLTLIEAAPRILPALPERLSHGDRGAARDAARPGAAPARG